MKTRLVLLASVMVLAQAAMGAAGATEWDSVVTNGRVELVGKTKIGDATHILAFSCDAMPGTWRLSQWNGYKILRMSASFDSTPAASVPQSSLIPGISPPRTTWPTLGLRKENGDPTVTIITGSGKVTIELDELMRSDRRLNRDAAPLLGSFLGPDYTSAEIAVSSRLMEILRRESTLHIRFGDPDSDAFGFTADLAPAKRKIIDFAESCR
jgi:hypothetical protein